MSNNYAVGIVTCNRPNFCKTLLKSLPNDLSSDRIFVENTGDQFFSDERVKNIHKFDIKTPVVFGKNALLRRMINETDADYLFLIEDDVEILDPLVFDTYINTSIHTGIQHLNFGFSQKENLDKDGSPLYKKIVEYPENVKIVLTHNILGAFSMYSRKCLETSGLMDENFNENAMEHVEHTYQIIKNDLHPPFWWFADVFESWKMIGNQGDINTTVIRHNEDYSNCIRRALQTFRSKHGVNLLEIFMTNESLVLQKLKKIYEQKNQYGRINTKE